MSSEKQITDNTAPLTRFSKLALYKSCNNNNNNNNNTSQITSGYYVTGIH